MMDFTLEVHDLAIANGDFALCATDKDAIAQAIAMRLKTMSGEWFLDTTAGISYFTDVFGHKRNERFIRQLIATAIETVPGVIRIDDFKAEMQANRRMLVILTVLISDRTLLPINEFIGF
jgi:hypothetical protein